MYKTLLLSAIAGYAASLEVKSSAAWQSATAGKSVFVKFYAPWCGHCQAIKEDWEKLEGDYESSETVGIISVDCTAKENKAICKKNGVEGFPTIKHGDPAALEDYDGERDYDSFKEFAAGLGPICSINNIELCSTEEKAQIEALKQKGDAALEEMVKEYKENLSKLQDDFEKFVEGLQEQYDQAEKKFKADTQVLNTKEIKFAKQIVGEPESEEQEDDEEEEGEQEEEEEQDEEEEGEEQDDEEEEEEDDEEEEEEEKDESEL